MDGLSLEVVDAVIRLLPGFIAAWCFYSLTAHPRPSPFERVIQALIFTVIIKSIVTLLRFALEAAGQFLQFGAWSNDVELVWSVVLALMLGLLFARLCNHNSVHEWLRRWEWWTQKRQNSRLKWLFPFEWHWTSRTSYPSEWFSVFTREKRHVILHLNGGRRIYGWPEEWPDQSDRGHFVILAPSWLLDSGQSAALHATEKVLIPVVDVEMVEFMKRPEEITASENEIDSVLELMVNENSKGVITDGRQSSTTTTDVPKPKDELV